MPLFFELTPLKRLKQGGYTFSILEYKGDQFLSRSVFSTYENGKGLRVLTTGGWMQVLGEHQMDLSSGHKKGKVALWLLRNSNGYTQWLKETGKKRGYKSAKQYMKKGDSFGY